MPLSLASKYHFFKNRMESEVFMRSALKGLMHINKAYMNQIKSVPVKNMRRHMEYFFKFRQQHPMVSRSVLNCGHVPLDILTPPGCSPPQRSYTFMVVDILLDRETPIDVWRQK